MALIKKKKIIYYCCHSTVSISSMKQKKKPNPESLLSDGAKINKIFTFYLKHDNPTFVEENFSQCSDTYQLNNCHLERHLY